jgi:hypothetical protein
MKKPQQATRRFWMHIDLALGEWQKAIRPWLITNQEIDAITTRHVDSLLFELHRISAVIRDDVKDITNEPVPPVDGEAG